MAFVANQDLGIGHHRTDQLRPDMIGKSALTQAQNPRSSKAFTQGMKLGVQAALRSTITTRSSPFCQTESCPVSFEVSGVDHDNVWFFSATGQSAEDAIKNTHSRPLHKAIVKGLVRSMNFRRIPPSQSNAHDVNNTTDDTPVIDTGFRGDEGYKV